MKTILVCNNCRLLHTSLKPLRISGVNKERKATSFLVKMHGYLVGTAVACMRGRRALVRFLLDQDVYAVTCRLLRDLGHDVVTAADLNLSRSPDTGLLMRAAEEKRMK